MSDCKGQTSPRKGTAESSSSYLCNLTSNLCNRTSMTDLASHYLEEIKRQFRGHKRMGEAAMAQLEDMDFFVTIDPESNSVAALVKHIAGNARSPFTDFLTSDGEKPDRFRDGEFAASAKTTREEGLGWWEQAWSHVFSALDLLQPQDVQHTVTIRQEPHP